MENTPVTVWRKTDGTAETVYTGITFIVDTLGDFLVDPIGNFIIDTGLEMPAVPTTVWVENQGV